MMVYSLGMKQLDPKAVWIFFANYLFSIFFAVIIIVWTLVFIFIQSFRAVITGQANLPWIILFLFNYWWLTLVLLAVILTVLIYAWSYLSWHFYRYELREDGFRKEHGVIWKKYVTIPYERIQNVDIYRGILARILKLSDLHIQTAGMSIGSGSYGGLSEGRLPGLSVQVAEQLRDELIKRARGKYQGL